MFTARNCIAKSKQLLSLQLFTRTSAKFNSSSTMDKTSENFSSITYSVKENVAHVQLNRPLAMNAIDLAMPFELESAVELACHDPSVKVIYLYGNKVFCSGYDLKLFAEGGRGSQIGSQKMPWDPYIDFKFMNRCNKAWMSLWHSEKPVVCKIEGVAIGGGSDMALCCDVTFMEDEARIGYPPSRVWGCPTTAMWVYRVGMEQAKRILFSGKLLTGKEAAKIGLIGQSFPSEKLDEEVEKFIANIKTVPTNQLFFQKQVINQAVEQMGLFSSQRLATFFDGMSRHTPEGVSFQERAKEVGFKQAVKERDSGLYTQWTDMNKSSKL